jgi:cardiolipin synthase
MLNFELSAAIQDKTFADQIESMFLADFDRSTPENLRKFEDGSIFFRLQCRSAALMSPEQ